MLRSAAAATLGAALALSSAAFAQTPAPMPDDKTMSDKTMSDKTMAEKPMHHHSMHHHSMHHPMHKPMAKPMEKPMSGDQKQM